MPPSLILSLVHFVEGKTTIVYIRVLASGMGISFWMLSYHADFEVK